MIWCLVRVSLSKGMLFGISSADGKLRGLCSRKKKRTKPGNKVRPSTLFIGTIIPLIEEFMIK